jgi:hypothetical protein
MNADVLTTTVADGIAVITLGSITELALARMRSDEEENLTSPSRSTGSWR